MIEVGYTIVETTAPSVEPVSAAELVAWLRLTGSDEATSEATPIAAIIKAARLQVEAELGRTLIDTTWTYERDAFPEIIELPRPPLSSVTTIKYYDEDGTQQTLAGTVYAADTSSEPGRVYLAYNQSWPSIRSQRLAVEVTYVGGYGDESTDVPMNIVTAIKIMAGDMYENREGQIVGTRVTDNKTVRRLLDPYRVPRIA